MGTFSPLCIGKQDDSSGVYEVGDVGAGAVEEELELAAGGEWLAAEGGVDAEQGLICGEGVRRGSTGALVVVEGGGEDPNILSDAEADIPGVEDEAFLDEGENSILVVAWYPSAGRLDGVKDHGAGLFRKPYLRLCLHREWDWRRFV